MNRISRFAETVVVSVGVSLAGLGLATGTAQADPAFGPRFAWSGRSSRSNQLFVVT